MAPRRKDSPTIHVNPSPSTGDGSGASLPQAADAPSPAGLPPLRPAAGAPQEDSWDPEDDEDDGGSIDPWLLASRLTGDAPARVAPQAQTQINLTQPSSPAPVGMPVRIPVIDGADMMPRQWRILVVRVTAEGRREELGTMPIGSTTEEMLSQWPRPGHYELMPIDEHSLPQRKLPVVKHIPVDHAYLQARVAEVAAGASVTSPGGATVRVQPAGLLDLPPGIVALITAEREARATAEEAARKAQQAALAETMRAMQDAAKAKEAAASRITEEVLVQVGNGYAQIEAARQRDQLAADKAMQHAMKVQAEGTAAQIKAAEQNTTVMQGFFAAQSTQMQAFLQLQVTAMQDATKLQIQHMEARVKQIEADAKVRIAAEQAAAERERIRMAEVAEERVALARAQAEAASPVGQLGSVRGLVEMVKELGLVGGDGAPEGTLATLIKVAVPVLRDVLLRSPAAAAPAGQVQVLQGVPPGMVPVQLPDGSMALVPHQQLMLTQNLEEGEGEEEEDPEDEPEPEGPAPVASPLRVVGGTESPKAPAPAINLPPEVQLQARAALKALLRQLRAVDMAEWEAEITAAVLANPDAIIPFCREITVRRAVLEAAGRDQDFGLRVFSVIKASGLIPPEIPLE